MLVFKSKNEHGVRGTKGCHLPGLHGHRCCVSLKILGCAGQSPPFSWRNGEEGVWQIALGQWAPVLLHGPLGRLAPNNRPGPAPLLLPPA